MKLKVTFFASSFLIVLLVPFVAKGNQRDFYCESVSMSEFTIPFNLGAQIPAFLNTPLNVQLSTPANARVDVESASPPEALNYFGWLR